MIMSVSQIIEKTLSSRNNATFYVVFGHLVKSAPEHISSKLVEPTGPMGAHDLKASRISYVELVGSVQSLSE
jgi:hypothetical protein